MNIWLLCFRCLELWLTEPLLRGHGLEHGLSVWPSYEPGGSEMCSLTAPVVLQIRWGRKLGWLKPCLRMVKRAVLRKDTAFCTPQCKKCLAHYINSAVRLAIFDKCTKQMQPVASSKCYSKIPCSSDACPAIPGGSCSSRRHKPAVSGQVLHLTVAEQGLARAAGQPEAQLSTCPLELAPAELHFLLYMHSYFKC